MEATTQLTALVEQLHAAKLEAMRLYDSALYAVEQAQVQLARMRAEQQRLNLDIKTEAEFAAELHVSVDTMRRLRRNHNLDHVRPCATEILYTAEHRVAACAKLTRPKAPKHPRSQP